MKQMIKEIYVKNFILIDELHLSFNKHFSCFSGETGAGKSLLIDAISILCGNRCSSQYIQNGAEKAFIEATIEVSDNHPVNEIIKEAGYDLEDDRFVISREFNRDGKSIARFNQRTTTVSFLKDVMLKLIDIHSQHDNQYLLNSRYHLSLLDEYINEKELLQQVKQSYFDWQQEVKKLKQFEIEEANPEELEYLRYQRNEMDQYAIDENEYHQLEEKQKQMASFDKVSMKLKEAITTIENSRYEILYEINKSLEGIEDTGVVKAKEEILNAYYNVDEQYSILKNTLENLEFDENEFDRIQKRLFEINRILRKHGGNFKIYQENYQKINEKISKIENRQQFIEKQKILIHEKEQEYQKVASQLSEIRKEKALSLEKEIQNELLDLHLPNAKFKVMFQNACTSTGNDQVEFLITMNAGESLRPLAKVASGGELSRLMLGLKTIFARLAKTDTIIFDEIDNGVSGSVAYAIGKKMHTIGKNTQVFAVTHLSPVAVWADQHYLVKKLQDTQTKTIIKPLEEDDIITELAMISQGNSDSHALMAAKDLYKKTQLLK